MVSINPGGPRDHPPRDARALASGRLSPLLALGVALSGRAAAARDGPARADPTEEWIAGQISEAFPWDEGPQYLLRDRDRIYGTIVTRRLRAMGIRDKPTA